MDLKEQILETLLEHQNPYKLPVDPLFVTRALIELKFEGLVDYEDSEKKIMCDGVVILRNVRLKTKDI